MGALSLTQDKDIGSAPLTLAFKVTSSPCLAVTSASFLTKTGGSISQERDKRVSYH